MFLLIDNFDSFTFNLVQLFEKMGISPLVLRNQDPSLLKRVKDPSLKALVISPGPGGPEDSGLCLSVLSMLEKRDVPVFGVCLGHQILGYFAGYNVIRAKRIMHGKTSYISHENHYLFKGIKNPFCAVRYHSLVIEDKERDNDSCPLDIIARSDDGEIMGICYRDRAWMGIQFHPESILTHEGPRIIENFLTFFVK